ncbi:MAG: ABC transporter permease [Bdellovibrionota bacterium]
MNRLMRILALTLKEFLVVVKDPKSRFIVIGPPLIQFFVFGYAATFDLREIRYAVFNEDHGAQSRELLARFQSSSHFRLTRTIERQSDIGDVIDPGDVRLVLHIGQGFSAALARGEPAPLQVIADGRNSNVAGIALGYVGTVVEQFNERALGVRSPLVVVNRSWFNPNYESRWFIVSALGGTISMVVVMLLTSLSVAREREQGTFDQLLVSPLTPGEILFGKSLPALVFGLADSLFLAAAGVFWFQLPFHGSIVALILTLIVFISSVVGVGLFVSSLSMTVQQGLLGSFVFTMPAVVLSGFTTPVENMPLWLQKLTYGDPLRFVIIALRKIFLQGAGLVDVLPQILPMCVIACITMGAATWLFRRRAG